MKTTGIICEYNPFHTGHAHQINEIKKKGDAIVCLMSGHITERGEFAIADKYTRAACAIRGGADLVLELPFPYCSSSAEFFAKGGVYIANALGIVDYLVFGSECGNIRELSDIASIMLSSEYQLYLDSLKNSPDYRDAGYPELCEKALSDIYGKEFSRDFFSPNNILGIEYIKALKSLHSDIEALTIRREGAGYLDIIKPMAEFQSASAIREEIACKNLSALDFVPQNAKNIYIKAIDEGKMPSDISRLDLALISFFRLNSPKADLDIHDATGGLYNRLCEMSAEATSISNLTKRTETKKYTTARIRRAIWNSYFGVTSSDIRSMPSYTQVLAMDSTGRAALKRIKKVTDFPVITKPSSYKDMDERVVKQKEMSNKADSVFALTLKVANSGRFALTFTPYVKE